MHYPDEITKEELWRRGVLFWKLHTVQLEIYEKLLENKNRLYACNTARRLGKSFLMVVYAIERCLQQKNLNVKYGTAFQTDLKDFIIPAFNLILQDCPEDIKPQYKVQQGKYVFANGSQIRLFGVDKNPDSGRGQANDIVILDECGFMDKLDYIIKSVIYPAMKNRPNAKLILISTPPVSPDHDFKKYCEEAQVKGSYSEFTIYDNPLFDQKTIEECIEESGGLESTTFKREYLCKFVVETERAIIPEWDSTKYIQQVPRDEYFQYYKPYVGMDLGFRDLTVLLFGYYDFKKASLIIENEYIINGHKATSRNIAENTINIESQLDYREPQRIADNSDNLFLGDLQSEYGVNFTPTSKDSKEAMVNELRMWVKNGRVIINPKCQHLIGCLNNGIWDKNRKQFDRSKIYGHYDAIDSLIYLVRNIDQVSNPIPITHNTTFNHYIPYEEPENVAAFKKIFNVKK